jgi:photosystem II stability/assembly factor-like uncharacterized protein
MVSMLLSGLALGGFGFGFGFGEAIPASQAASNSTFLSVGDSNWLMFNGIMSGNYFNDADCPSSTVCYVVGDAGLLLTTYDGGNTWQSTPYLTTSDFLAINCPGLTLCYATTRKGEIYKYDGGVGWGSFQAGFWSLQYTTQPERWLTDVDCFSATNCVAVGYDGMTARTTNGKNWTGAVTTGGGSPIKYLKDVTCPTITTCYAVGSFDTILLSIDGGVSWGIQSNEVGIDGDWVSVTCPSSTSCYAVSNKGHFIVNKANGPTDWTLRSSIPQSALQEVVCPSTDVCYILSSDSAQTQVYKNSNSQLTGWTKQSISSRFFPTGISCSSATTCMLTSMANIFTTTNGGSNWLRRSSQMDENLTDIACPSATVCYTVGLRGGIYKTGTNWLNWQILDSPLTTDEGMNSISCPSVQVCYAVGNNGISIGTTNSGQSWSKLANVTQSNLNGVSCRTNTDCLAVGDDGVILELNSSSQWEIRPSGVTTELNAVSCASSTNCYAVGDKGVIRRSTNGGTTWQAEPSGITSTLRDISCPSNIDCYAVSGSGLLQYSASAGNWQLKNGAGSNLHSITCSTSTKCHIVNIFREVYTSDNSGGIWTKETSGTVSNFTYSSIACPTICLVVGKAGSVLASAVPVYVTTDDSSGLLEGTLSYALSRVTENQKQHIQMVASSVQLTESKPLPNLKRTSVLQGKCNSQPKIKAPINTNVSGLILEGENTVSGIELSGFRGPVIRVDKGYGGNKLNCVKAISK